jgi:molecular chaperone HscC
LSEAEVATRLRAMDRLKLHPRDQGENTALLARLRRVYEMAGGADRPAIQHMLIEFEAALLGQDPATIDRLRGNIAATLDLIDDYYVT